MLLQNRNSTFYFILFPNVPAQNAYYLSSVKGLGYPVIHARTLHHIKLIVKEQYAVYPLVLYFSQRNAKPIRCAFCKLIIKS